MRILKKILFWVLPVAILIFIFQVIDTGKLISVLKQADPKAMCLGLLPYPLIIFLGAYRWKTILSHYLSQDVGLGYAVRHYWIGNAIGKLLPGSLTWDAYRVMVAGRSFGNFPCQILAVLMEKIAALLVALLATLCIYPLVISKIPPEALARKLTAVFPVGEIVFSWPIVGLAVLLIGLFGYLLLKWSRNKKTDWLRSLSAPLFKPGPFVRMMVPSLGIYLGMAMANYFFFCSLNTPLPFVVHFFLMPVYAMLLLLPITFGGLGVREGAFIFFYGMFGISTETALIVSFLNLAASLMNSAVGGLILLSTTLAGGSEEPKSTTPEEY